MKNKAFYLLLVFALLISLSCRFVDDALSPGDTPTPPEITPPSVSAPTVPAQTSGKIVYISANDLFVMNADGSGEQQLTQTKDIREIEPRWSYDGQKIVYSTVEEKAIYLVSADGSELTRVRPPADEAPSPAWSPDNSQIIFVAKQDTLAGLYLMDANGQNERLVFQAEPLKWIGSPAFSPAGDRIAFVYSNILHVINSDGSGLARIQPDDGGMSANPAWSPDGKRIAYASIINKGDSEIFLIDPDGQNQVQITDNDVNDEHPCWSADGKRLVFASESEGGTMLFTLNADGSEVVQLTSVYSTEPHWQPGLP